MSKKTLQDVIARHQARKESVDRSTAVSELKDIVRADWQGEVFMSVPHNTLQGIADHIYRLEEELGKAKQELAKSSVKSTSVVKTTKKFQVGDRVRSILHTDYRYIITGQINDKTYSSEPNSDYATDRVRHIDSTERVPLAEFNFRDIQVGDTIEYSGFKYIVSTCNSDVIYANTANGFGSILVNKFDVDSKNIKVVDTPQ